MTMHKMNLIINIKNILIPKYKIILSYVLFFYYAYISDIIRAIRIILLIIRLIYGIYFLFLLILLYNNYDIINFLQDFLYWYINNSQDILNESINIMDYSVNMSSLRGNGNSIPPIGGDGMNGTPSPGGGGNESSSLILAGNSSNNNDNLGNYRLGHQPRSDIFPTEMGSFKRVKGGFLTGDGVFIKDDDYYRVPVKYMENVHNVRGVKGLHGVNMIKPSEGLLAGSENGYGIGRLIWNNNNIQHGFIVPCFPTSDSMTGPGIFSIPPFTTVGANFIFPHIISNPEKSIISSAGISTYIELGIKYRFYPLNPVNLYVCELTYPDGFKYKYTNLGDLSTFILNHRSRMLGCSTDVLDQHNIMSDPYFNTIIYSTLNNWIRHQLAHTTTAPDYAIDVYRDLVQEFWHLNRNLSPLPSTPSSSSSASFELETVSSENNDDEGNGIA